MTRILAALGLGLLLAGCAAPSGYQGYGNGYGAPAYNFGPYDGPRGGHGGAFAG